MYCGETPYPRGSRKHLLRIWRRTCCSGRCNEDPICPGRPCSTLRRGRRSLEIPGLGTDHRAARFDRRSQGRRDTSTLSRRPPRAADEQRPRSGLVAQRTPDRVCPTDGRGAVHLSTVRDEQGRHGPPSRWSGRHRLFGSQLGPRRPSDCIRRRRSRSHRQELVDHQRRRNSLAPSPRRSRGDRRYSPGVVSRRPHDRLRLDRAEPTSVGAAGGGST